MLGAGQTKLSVLLVGVFFSLVRSKTSIGINRRFVLGLPALTPYTRKEKECKKRKQGGRPP